MVVAALGLVFAQLVPGFSLEWQGSMTWQHAPTAESTLINSLSDDGKYLYSIRSNLVTIFDIRANKEVFKDRIFCSADRFQTGNQFASFPGLLQGRSEMKPMFGVLGGSGFDITVAALFRSANGKGEWMFGKVKFGPKPTARYWPSIRIRESTSADRLQLLGGDKLMLVRHVPGKSARAQLATVDWQRRSVKFGTPRMLNDSASFSVIGATPASIFGLTSPSAKSVGGWAAGKRFTIPPPKGVETDHYRVAGGLLMANAQDSAGNRQYQYWNTKTKSWARGGDGWVLISSCGGDYYLVRDSSGKTQEFGRPSKKN